MKPKEGDNRFERQFDDQLEVDTAPAELDVGEEKLDREIHVGSPDAKARKEMMEEAMNLGVNDENSSPLFNGLKGIQLSEKKDLDIKNVKFSDSVIEVPYQKKMQLGTTLQKNSINRKSFLGAIPEGSAVPIDLATPNIPSQQEPEQQVSKFAKFNEINLEEIQTRKEDPELASKNFKPKGATLDCIEGQMTFA